jgi:hypothetical protein
VVKKRLCGWTLIRHLIDKTVSTEKLDSQEKKLEVNNVTIEILVYIKKRLKRIIKQL